MKPILRLRKLKRTDRKYFLKWWTDKELIALTSGRTDSTESAEKLGKYFEALLKVPHNYMITVNGKVIGHVMLKRRGQAFGFPIVIGESRYRGQGYGSQAIRKILRLGFGQLGYTKAKLEVRPENARAIKTYSSLGFKAVGVKKYDNPYQPEVVVMALAKEDFVGRR